MLSGGSQLAFRALRCYCATDQKAWSVSRQNTHRNHLRKRELCMRHSAAAQGRVGCHRWPVHLISGGLLVPSHSVAPGCVSWAAGECGDGEQSCTSGSGSSAHRECGCTELSRATSEQSKGTGLLPCWCSSLCTAQLSSFRQERFWAAVAPFQELIRTWNRAQVQMHFI